ncbi:MAG TPA: hypothetical protein PKY87_14865 [Terricaulis sp.]|nr:hypothetical protein [Terricaulis sp.]
MARELVAEAASVERMRVISRRAVDTNEVISEYYGQVYAYRFERLAVTHGRRGRPLELHGLDENWLQAKIPRAWRYERSPLDWMRLDVYTALQETRIPDPSDSGSLACATPMTFVVGAEYLVFRDRSGALLAPGFAGVQERRQWRRERPVIERLHGANDPWRIAVEAAAAEYAETISPWRAVFALAYGLPRSGN